MWRGYGKLRTPVKFNIQEPKGSFNTGKLRTSGEDRRSVIIILGQD
jgi:hypothetical protein